MHLPSFHPAACGLLLAALAGATTPGAAQPAAAPIAFTTVAEALAALRARDGNGTIVTQADGWVTVNEPLANAQWSFTPAEHEAYPAVVRRVILRGADRSASVGLASLCEAPAAACGRLRQQFEAMNDRIIQAVRARGRSASTPAAAPAQ